MRIGIVSDTHGSLSALAVDALQGCDRIIHAGDIGSSNVLYKLEAIAPVTAVVGNCDYNDYGPEVGYVAETCIDGVSFFVTHRPEDLPFLDPGRMDVAVNGHTHVPLIERKHGVLRVNPGSVSRPRGGEGPTIAIVTTRPGRVAEARIVPLLQG